MTLCQSRDHPRACGEQSGLPSLTVYPLGSPPRLRGADTVKKGDTLSKRITPAPAGSSSEEEYRARIRQDHPRACGEQARIRHLRELEEGSPPRLRGAAAVATIWMTLNRITPAPAGSRLSALFFGAAVSGSPPRLRGAAWLVGVWAGGLRITPAPAGSRLDLPQSKRQREDHPRACGEQFLQDF